MAGLKPMLVVLGIVALVIIISAVVAVAVFFASADNGAKDGNERGN